MSINLPPIISFVLISFNQENCIRDAVKGALAQTYSPLEIVFSDDCSTDRTYQIIQEMVSGYTGPHKIILNRNLTNGGIGSHINRIMELSSGELIVIAAGDDISERNRTQVLADYWMAHGKFTGSIYSAELVIDEEGRVLGRMGEPPPVYRSLYDAVRNNCSGIHGASHAWDRRIFERFGPFNAGLIAEDRAFGLRSFVFGDIHYLDKPLVRYRTHSSNVYNTREGPRNSISLDEISKKNVRNLGLELNWRRQFQADLKRLPEIRKFSTDEIELASECNNQRIKELIIHVSFENTERDGRVLLALRSLLGNECSKILSIKLLLRSIFPFLENWNRRKFARKRVVANPQ